MTTKYDSVLSEAELAELCGVEVGNPNYLVIASIAKHVQQATLAKLQPQLDAIGAGGVSGQRITKNTEEWSSDKDGRNLYSSDFVHDVMLKLHGDFESDSQRVEYVKALIEKLNHKAHIPEGYKLVPIKPTPETRANQETETQELRVVFSGEAPNLTFVEVENEDGFSVNAGQWHKRFDGYTELRIKAAKE